MQDIKNNAQNEGVTSPTDKEWEEVSDVMKSVLTFKSEDKSEAFLMTKRCRTGTEAWCHVNRWYMTISGESLADRMSYIMKPPHAKRDEDVMMTK